MQANKRTPITIGLTGEQRLQLRALRTSPALSSSDATLEQILQYVVASVCDGIRRPGSWERGVVASMFGEWDVPPPPLCSICGFDLLDEDEPLELESKHCERCLYNAIDEWVVMQARDWPEEREPRASALAELVWTAMGFAEMPGDPKPSDEDVRAARELCWEAMGRKSPLKPLDDPEPSVRCDESLGLLRVDVH